MLLLERCYLDGKYTVPFRITPGTYEKVTCDLGLGGDFRRVVQFPPPFTDGYSHELAATW